MQVSIIIPTHNNPILLTKTLTGLISQKNHTLFWEIIIIDNKSDQGSITYVYQKFKSQLPISLLQQPNLKHPFSLCKARNLGIKTAQGEWIISIDSDIILNSQYLKVLETKIKEWGNKPTIATGKRIFINTDAIDAKDMQKNPNLLDKLTPVLSPSNYCLREDRRLPEMNFLPAIEHPWDYMHGCNVIYRRQDAIQVGGYEELYDGQWGFEDIDFAYRMITKTGCTPHYLQELYVYHQDSKENTANINRYDKSNNRNWARICQTIPGYKSYKIAKYHKLSQKIHVA